MRRKVLLIGMAVFIIMVCAVMYMFSKVVMNNNDLLTNTESSSYESSNDIVYEYDSKYIFLRYVREFIYYNYLKEQGIEKKESKYAKYYKDYFTERFMTKFQNGTDLYSDVDDVFEVGRRTQDEKDDEVILIMDWKESTGKQFHTCVVYQLVFDDDNKIDDCKIIDSYNIDIRTEQRLDRPMIIDVYDAEGYITVFLRPIYFHHGEAVTYLNEWGNIPKSADCQIINLPPEPTKDCEVRFPYYKLTYKDEQIKYYKVEYTYNDKAQFTRIEFIEITAEEYNIMASQIRRGLF